MSYSLPTWAYAYGSPVATGSLKMQATDFIVDEILPFQPEGTGEHLFLHIQKQNENTEYVARLLARIAGVRQRDIGFAGLKDRHALTSQWFSVWLPGKPDLDKTAIQTPNIKVLQTIRHSRKLKRGTVKGNQFNITIRDFNGDPEQFWAHLAVLKTQGFPNYFAEQRFGHDGQNINTAIALFNGAKMKPDQRSIYLSAARAYLFNLILSHRVQLKNWHQAIAGDVYMINQSHSYFKTDCIDAALQTRIASGDIHPTACLYGQGENPATQTAFAIEHAILQQHPMLTAGLVKFGLEMNRRALRCYAENLHADVEAAKHLRLSFFLTAGSYATALLRELVQYT